MPDLPDQVDLFSGRLSVAIPIGPFQLFYNNNVWRYSTVDEDGVSKVQALAHTFLAMGEREDAEGYFQEALQGAIQFIQSPPNRLIVYYTVYIEFLAEEGRFDEISSLRVRLAEATHEPVAPFHQVRLLQLDARLAALQGETQRARRLLEEAMAVEVFSGVDHPVALATRLGLAELALLEKRWKDAAEGSRSLRRVARERLGEDALLFLEAELVHGTALLHLGDEDEGLRLVQSARERLPPGWQASRMGSSALLEALARRSQPGAFEFTAR